MKQFDIRWQLVFSSKSRYIDRITPQMNRITFGGEALAGFESRGAEDHLASCSRKEITTPRRFCRFGARMH
ncbi:MAG: siderophore-interacting protein [Thermomicrobiales bacterium]